jgi:Fic family protein
MGKNNGKMTVLRSLQQEDGLIAIQDLLHKLGSGYAERTVRRWLQELILDGVVEKEGEKRGTKYRAIPLRTEGQCFGPQSQEVMALVRRPLQERYPVTYVEEWLDSYTPNRTFYIPLYTRRKLRQEGERSKKEDPAGTYAHHIFNRLLIDLSYNSSRLEGNTYSLLDTQKLLLEGKSPEGKMNQETTMIINHKEAIRYLVDNADRLEVKERTIFDLHYLLSEGLIDSHYSGKIRADGVGITGSAYIPYENPKRLRRILEKILHKAALIDDPYEQSLFLLIHISYLQAFFDVNKRTARLAANISLIKNNLVPLSFNDVDKDDYTTAIIAIYELRNVQPLLDLYVFSYLRTCAMYDATVKSLGFDEVRVRYRQKRRALLSRIILEKLTGEKLRQRIELEAKNVMEKDRESFIGDVYEDLREMDEARLIGLGVTPDQLEAWQTLQSTPPAS